jgi:mannose/cellobiose epimerase-like protein (N-acyl-D-glucosamine 2-epimerase family)
MPDVKDIPVVHPAQFLTKAFLNQHIAKTMAFYHPRCIDKQGGFYHFLSDDGSIYDSSQRHLVSSTRYIFNYAMAYLNTEDIHEKATYKAAVEHGLSYLRNNHLNPVTKGYAWLIDGDAVIDGTNHCYGLAFVLLAYAKALQIGFSECAEYIEQTYQLMEQHFWQQDSQLYADQATADWTELDDYRGQNANMHSCEAMIAAYEATQNTRYLDRAFTLAEGICIKQAALAEGQIWEHYSKEWQIDWQYNLDDPKNLFRPWGFQPGHFTEWAKLLLTLDRYRPTTWLLPKAQQLFDQALTIAWDKADGGICYGFSPEGSVCDDDKYFWVQAESFAAAALLFERSENDEQTAKYLKQYQQIWQYSWQHMIDHKYGAWYRILNGDNSKIDDCKSPAGKTDYHTMGACYEVLAMLNRLESAIG